VVGLVVQEINNKPTDMKKFLLAACLLISISGFTQNKYYATVFDEDNNPVARGLFKCAADSGLIIVVDGMEIFINASEITTLKIEKNPSRSEFLKLGTDVATEMATYLINKPKRSIEEQTDSLITDSAADQQSAAFNTETKTALLQRLNQLLQDLLSGRNDVARFSINNSPEKFLTKLHLLQQYSIDNETVHWSDIASSEETVASSNASNDQASIAVQPRNSSIKIPSSSSVVMNKGIRILSRPKSPAKQSENQLEIQGNIQVNTATKNDSGVGARAESPKPVSSNSKNIGVKNNVNTQDTIHGNIRQKNTKVNSSSSKKTIPSTKTVSIKKQAG